MCECIACAVHAGVIERWPQTSDLLSLSLSLSTVVHCSQTTSDICDMQTLHVFLFIIALKSIQSFSLLLHLLRTTKLMCSRPARNLVDYALHLNATQYKFLIRNSEFHLNCVRQTIITLTMTMIGDRRFYLFIVWSGVFEEFSYFHSGGSIVR